MSPPQNSCSLRAVYRGWKIWRALRRRVYIQEGVAAAELPPSPSPDIKQYVDALPASRVVAMTAQHPIKLPTPWSAVAGWAVRAILGLYLLAWLTQHYAVALMVTVTQGVGKWIALALLITFAGWVTYRIFSRMFYSIRFIQMLCDLGQEAMRQDVIANH